MTALRHLAEALLLVAVQAVGRLIGRRRAGRLGRALGRAWYALGSAHRGVAAENLRHAFPELPASRRAAIARASFEHFGELVLDLLVFAHYRADAATELAVIEGWENLEKARAKGMGVLVHSAHFGHWELVALLQGLRGFPMDMVVRPMDNPHLERFVTRLRCQWGNRVIHKRRAVRGILKGIREKRAIGMVIDQNYNGVNPFFVSFFGRAAATTPTLGLLAVRTGAPVVPVFCRPHEDGRYRIVYLPEVEMQSSGDRGLDAYRLTSRCTEIIEDQIRGRPELWSWMHQRWRTRPREDMPAERPASPARRYRRRAEG